LLGKPQNYVSRICKERAQTLLVIFGNKLVLVYSAVVWVREKHVIISNYSAWTRQRGGKIKGRFERKLSFTAVNIYVLLSKLRHHVVPSVGATVYYK
jgi:hypothetical protein